MNHTAKLGVRVSLIIHHAPLELDLLHPGVEVVRLPKLHKDLRFLPLASYMARAKPTHLLSNREWGNWNAFLAKFLSRAPTGLVFRVGNPLDSTLKRRNPLKRALRAKKIEIAYRHAHLVICNSVKIRDDVLTHTRCPAQRIVVLRNPTISCETLALANEVPALPLKITPGERIIVAIGRLARQKSFDTLIKAFSLVSKHLPTRLLLIGDGKEKANLQGLCKDLGVERKVDFLGYQKNPYPYLRLANLFVLSSAWEGSPNVLIEALSLGVPVVATDCPSGPREILENGRYGPLVAVGDHLELASAIKKVLSHPLPAEVLREAARPFHADSATRQYLRAMGVLNDG